MNAKMTILCIVAAGMIFLGEALFIRSVQTPELHNPEYVLMLETQLTRATELLEASARQIDKVILIASENTCLPEE